MNLFEVRNLLFLFFLAGSVIGICKQEPLTEVEQLIVDWHNIYRTRHIDTEPICYGVSGKDIEFKSEYWAQHLTEEGVEFHHFPDPKLFGENMMWTNFYEEEPDPIYLYMKAMHKWYKEIEFWDFGQAGKNESHKDATTTHFTQVVWKTTSQVNCAYSFVSQPDRKAYVVCQYWPKGNFLHQYKTHVLAQDPDYVPDPSKQVGITSNFTFLYPALYRFQTIVRISFKNGKLPCTL